MGWNETIQELNALSEAKDRIRELEAQLSEANAENIEQSRLLGMSAERELSLQAQLSEANKAKDEAIGRIKDMLKEDDAQAFKEARKWLAKHGGREMNLNEALDFIYEQSIKPEHKQKSIENEIELIKCALNEAVQIMKNANHTYLGSQYVACINPDIIRDYFKKYGVKE